MAIGRKNLTLCVSVWLPWPFLEDLVPILKQIQVDFESS